MPILDQLIPLYLTACTVEGKTDRTVQSYAETLRQFRRAVDKLDLPVSIEAFGPAHVYLFMGWVRERGVSAGTQHRRQREVKAFFSWCRRMDYVEENPFMRVPMVRREQKVVQPFCKGRPNDLASCLQSQDLRGLSHEGDDPLPPRYRGALKRARVDSSLMTMSSLTRAVCASSMARDVSSAGRR